MVANEDPLPARLYVVPSYLQTSSLPLEAARILAIYLSSRLQRPPVGGDASLPFRFVFARGAGGNARVNACGDGTADRGAVPPCNDLTYLVDRDQLASRNTPHDLVHFPRGWNDDRTSSPLLAHAGRDRFNSGQILVVRQLLTKGLASRHLALSAC